jgi:hypothetical protein
VSLSSIYWEPNAVVDIHVQVICEPNAAHPLTAIFHPGKRLVAASSWTRTRTPLAAAACLIRHLSLAPRRACHLACRWCWMCSRAATCRRLPPRRPELTGIGTPPPLCCKYIFQVFQTFQRYVVVVSYGYCTCCKCFRDMLQEFVQNVSSVQMYIASVLIRTLHMFYTYVATVHYVPNVSSIFHCSKCFCNTPVLGLH